MKTTVATDNVPAKVNNLLGRHYPTYVLIILFIVYIFNFIDRQILTILVQPIKEEFGVSDSAIGFLTGTAFALFYATLGIPIARLADRYTRRSIVALALTIWSGMTALSGTATSFLQMAIFRIGVAVGEAGASPPIHSIIADYFKPHKRATALAIYSMGIPVGGTIGIMLGGWISEAYSWRTAFFLVGIPGLIMAIIVRLTIREPRRGESEEVAGKPIKVTQPEPTPLAKIMPILKRQRSFKHMALGSAMHAFVGYGLAAFNPAFIERVFDVSRADIGVQLGLVAGITGAAGVMTGGWLTDKLAVYDRRWYMWTPGISMLISVPFYIAAYLADSFWLFLMLYALPSFMGSLYAGPVFATTQSLVPLGMRAMAAAILLFVINIIGLGLGPQVIGVISDVINNFTFDGADDGASLQYALLFACLVKFWAAAHYYLAAKTIRADLDRVASITSTTTSAEN